MNTVDRLLAFEAWANLRILAAVQALPPETVERACALLGHVANGLSVWYQRVAGQEVTARPWTPLTLDECGAELKRQHGLWAELVRANSDLTRVISYSALDGTPYQTPLVDILQHLSFHSCYHRGQVNAAIRAAGGAPASVDFIAFQREGN